MFGRILITAMLFILIKELIDLMNLIEQGQYKAGLIVSGCWQGTNRERLYGELGCGSLCPIGDGSVG